MLGLGSLFSTWWHVFAVVSEFDFPLLISKSKIQRLNVPLPSHCMEVNRKPCPNRWAVPIAASQAKRI